MTVSFLLLLLLLSLFKEQSKVVKENLMIHLWKLTHKNMVTVLNIKMTSNSRGCKTLPSIHLSSDELLRQWNINLGWLPLCEH